MKNGGREHMFSTREGLANDYFTHTYPEAKNRATAFTFLQICSKLEK